MAAQLLAGLDCAPGEPFGIAVAAAEVDVVGVCTHHEGRFPLARVVKAAALVLRVFADERNDLDVRERIVAGAEVFIVIGIGVAAPPAAAHGVLHVFHGDLLGGLMAGNGHGHEARFLGLMVRNAVDVLHAAVDHRLEDAI